MFRDTLYERLTLSKRWMWYCMFYDKLFLAKAFNASANFEILCIKSIMYERYRVGLDLNFFDRIVLVS